ncbi:MAG TPA: hypothetical protein VM939_14265, partial [Gemmatimonadaceae bacterium]|nr:hypothetical protein [Gemmatimonadaceae bacterium]
MLSVLGLAMIGACADSPAGPDLRATVTNTGTLANAGKVNVCIDATSPAGTYTISSAGSVTPSNGSFVLPASIDLAPGACGTLYQRTAPTSSGVDDFGTIKATVTSTPADVSIN